MKNDIRISQFTGMNNIKDSGGLFVKKGVVEPRIILNADATGKGRLTKRDGYTEVVSLTNGHSMWSGATCHLVMDGITLKRLEGDTLTSIDEIGSAVVPMFYAEVGDKVYMSNNHWNGIFDPETNAVSSWGITLPNGPMCSLTGGGLPAGTYLVCMTAESNGEISGSGPISRITLASEGGISISNREANDTVWCTDPNGGTFFRIGKQSVISDITSVEPLPSLFCSPPPFVKYLTHAFGRMWGFIEDKLYYSNPFKPDWWRLSTAYFQFATIGTMIARVSTGLFIGCEDRTYCLLGTKPEEMRQLDVGSGAIPGTLAYCNDIRELGDTISPPEKKHTSVPVWVSQEGIVAGNPVGRLFSLSQQKVKFTPGNTGASLYRKKNGQFQFLTSFPKGAMKDGFGMSDEATVEVVRNGKVI